MKPNDIMKSLVVVAFFVFGLALTGCDLTREKTAASVLPTNTQILPTNSPEPLPTEVVATKPPDPTSTVTIEPEIVHNDLPGSPFGKINQTVHDQVDENTAPNKQAFGGDDFRNGKYERPFDQEMNYLPLTDLVSVQLNREDPLWVYILYKVNKPFSINPSANTHFMIELDTDLDNRGDILIVTGTPKETNWSTDSVLVFTNPDLNVGGVTVVRPDANLSEGRGYYEEIFNNGKGIDPDLAWSRFSKVDQAVVEIAFKNTLTGGEKGKFIWLPWANSGMLDWTLMEYNDHITFAEAGYPIKDDPQNYPLKALWGVDNTCRITSGFTPNGVMPGLCITSSPEGPEHSSPDNPGTHFCARPCISHPGCCD